MEGVNVSYIDESNELSGCGCVEIRVNAMREKEDEEEGDEEFEGGEGGE